PERPAAAELRDFLRGRLPEFLVPSAFVVLDALPLTPNGKVDRAALSRIGLGNPERVFETPRGFLEETLAAVFADVLGTGPVGRHDGFFDLGGHSLLATRAVSRLRSLLGVEVPLRLLFETPTVAELAGRIGRETGIPALPPIVPAFEEEKSRPAPLSYAQRRLWFLDRFDPGSPAYNIAAAIHLSGPLDAAALTGALEEIVRRHEALRTTFREEDGEPVQVVSPPGGMALPLIDLSARESSPPGPLSQGERGRKAKEETNSSSPSPGDGEGGRWERGPGGEDSEGRRLIQEEARRPFDLRWGPLFRPLLLRFAEEKYILFVMLHHIVGDGWSAGVMVRELAALYSRSPLPELPVQYTDYARWQRRWLTGEVLEAELVPWRERLQGLPARLDLPTDRPRPAVQRLRGALRPAELSEEVTTALATLARREGATLFMALLAGFQALLGRYTGQDDLAVGTPVAGRDREEIEGLIGFFVNTLVLRGDLAGDPSFTELLARTRETALAAQAHRALPFEVLVEELRPERSLAHAPLFQVMLAFQGVPDESLRMERVDTGTAKLDLLLDLAHRGGRLAGFLEYDTDLFDAATVDRLLAHFEVLLAGAVAEPATRLSELPLLTSEERWQLLAEAGADVEAPWRTLHEGFERQAERTPDRIAVVWGEQRVSYGDLARRSGEMVAGPETIVAVRMPRTPELVVRLLGVLR
ncbi:MAG TPA: condensation domain-containing protein, partial [Thermoanaerobaculia bacterium]|nr:condensation domain-containing protein [Thermoanaerobaculia bacterium]